MVFSHCFIYAGHMKSLPIIRIACSCIAFLVMALPHASSAMVQQPVDQDTPKLPQFSPETGRYMLFEHVLIRQGADWQARTTITRCIRFTAIGRGFRADSHIISVDESGPKRLVALLSLTQSIRENEHLIFDLNAQGQIIGLRDEVASWERLANALQGLRADLPALIDSPSGQVAGERLIDNILATPVDQQRAYLAEGFLPVMAMHPYFSKTDQWPLILPFTQETVELGNWDKDRMSLSIKSLPPIPDAETDNISQTRSEGHMTISRKDGLLLESQRNIYTRIGDSERMATEKWQRIGLDGAKGPGKCAMAK